jgi:hypothetical protein
VYTTFTGRELGETPFLCPSDYNYSSKAARLVCQVRAANLICMWLMFLFNLFVTFTMYIPGKDSEEVGGRLNAEVNKDTEKYK